jgi:4-hydroxy-3-polyprenylbenzoate decarboxylase
MKRFVMAMTGASGPAIGLKVVGELLKEAEVHLVISPTALSIMRDEVGLDWVSDLEDEVRHKARGYFSSQRLYCWAWDNLEAPVSSGSFHSDGMLVVPCSMKTLAGIANGYAGTLIERAADVTIKEGRTLLVSPRETPFSAIHLENMLKLARLGVRVVPPVPAFYHKPDVLDDMIDFLAGKILDSIGVEHQLFTRWGKDL